MTLAPMQQVTPFREDNQHSQIDNPFIHRTTKFTNSSTSTEHYIKSWIDNIFYSSAKIDAEARFAIHLRFADNKSDELSSCSIVYSIIRERMKEISCQQRQFINHSYETLVRESSSLCGNNDPLNSWNKNWRQFKQQNESQLLKNVNPTIARLFVISYRYMCEVSREIYNFWKVLYDCTQIKDLRFNTPQHSLNQLLLDVFTESVGSFKPTLILPTMSFAQKCKFIYAEVDGIARREELARFYEDQMVKKLVARKDIEIKNEDLAQEVNCIKADIKKYDEPNYFSRKYETLLHKNRLDHKDFEKIRTFYIENECESTEDQRKTSEVVERHSMENFTNYSMSRDKLDLIHSLADNKQVTFEIEDASSQEDSENDIDPFYYSNQNNREQLIEEGAIFQIDAVVSLDKHRDHKETEQSSKVSSSEGNQQLHDSQDMPIKNYEVEVPLEFIYNEQAEDGNQLIDSDTMDKNERAKQCELEFELGLQQNLKLSLQQSLRDDISLKMSKLQLNITKSKQSIKQEKKVQKLDKRKLEEEKQKLQKYRRQLQKQKEELLKEVERFMKQKKREENLLMIMKDTKIRGRYHHNGNLCKYQNINYKIIHKLQEHQHKLQSITLEYQTQQQADRCCQEELNRLTEQDRIETELMERVKNGQSIFGTEPVKLSKKQQKLRKRVERQMREGLQEKEKIQKKPKQEKIGLCQQEACLSNFLEQLLIDDGNRVACNIEQSRLGQWKQKINAIRSNKIQFAQRNDEGDCSSVVTKKKKKNRK